MYNYITLDTKNKSTLEIGELVTGTNATLNYCNIKNGDDGGTVIASYTSTFTDKKTIDVSNYDLVTITIYGSAKVAYQTINVNDIYLY